MTMMMTIMIMVMLMLFMVTMIKIYQIGWPVDSLDCLFLYSQSLHRIKKFSTDAILCRSVEPSNCTKNYYDGGKM